MKRLLAFLALCLPIYIIAQGFGSFSHDQPYFAKDAAASSEINPQTLEAKHWWIYTTMPTNSLNATNWVDTIASSVWTNATTGASRPVNEVLGLKFTGTSSQQLTNVGVIQHTNCATWMIIRREDNGGFKYVLSHANSGDLNLGFYVDDVNFLEAVSVAYFDGTIPINTWFDLAWVNDGANNKNYIYTNGIVALTNNFHVNLANARWKFLGGIPAGGFLTGSIREIAAWTNAVVSASNIFELHKYGTNKYNY